MIPDLHRYARMIAVLGIIAGLLVYVVIVWLVVVIVSHTAAAERWVCLNC